MLIAGSEEQINEVVDKLLGWNSAPQMEDLPPDDPILLQGRIIEGLFTATMDGLRSGRLVGSDIVKAVAGFAWDMIEHKVVLSALASDEWFEKMARLNGQAEKADYKGPRKFLAFASQGALGDADSVRGTVYVPTSWAQMFAADRIMQMGAVAFVASQVRDAAHGKIAVEPQHKIVARAYAVEADFLLAYQARHGRVEWNEHQRWLLGQMPSGWGSLPENFKYVPRASSAFYGAGHQNPKMKPMDMGKKGKKNG